jgi:ubiquinone/menaquinone biosynthesis C-methylase UbiE
MTTPNKGERSNKSERSHTYAVQDTSSESELTRLIKQNAMLNAAMEGVLPEQEHPEKLRRILDIACGSGNWAMDVADTYPEVSVIGVDISQRMMNYARSQVRERQLADRVEFHVMDALLSLEFPNSFFDLVNIRLAFGFMRTWDWPKLFSEMLRVTKYKGIIRVTEEDLIHPNNGPSYTQIMEISVCGFYRAGHLFEDQSSSIIDNMPRLFVQHGVSNIQTRAHMLAFHAGTPEGHAYYEDMKHAFHNIKPFLEKRGCAPPDYDAIYQQALEEMQRPDFHVTWPFLTVWGNKL